MSAIEKEKIFVELRKYHQDEFTNKPATEKMAKLREEFGVFEDKMVTMILSLVNGKLAYEDLTPELDAFRKKVKITPAGDRKEDENRKFFTNKIDQLANILEMAGKATFKLKIPRGIKAKVR